MKTTTPQRYFDRNSVISSCLWGGLLLSAAVACGEERPKFGTDDSDDHAAVVTDDAEASSPAVTAGETDGMPGTGTETDGNSGNNSATDDSADTDGSSDGDEADDGTDGADTDDTTNADTDDSTEPVGPEGGCPNGCLIAGTCHSNGEVNADNNCAVCDPSLSTSAWTNADGRSCDDGLYCTIDDYCSAGECLGDERLCDDGVACNGAETCDEANAQCASATSTCEEGEICDVENDVCGTTCAGCVIDGSCYTDGDASPTNPCLVCDPAASAESWSVTSGEACDDGDLCTEQDACDTQGQCVGTEVSCENDTGACGATRTCAPSSGECVAQFPGNSVSCNDMDACTSNDRCDGSGQCVGTPGVGAGCACIDNSDCNDNLACTQDTCNEGTCSNTLQSGSCLIAGACVANGSPDPTNECRSCDASGNPTAWTNASPGTSCDDGVWCNGTDTCSAGMCTHQFPTGNRCTGTGPCDATSCDENLDSCFAPSTQICGTGEEFRCAPGGGCGGIVQSRPTQQFCSGNASACTGTVQPSSNTWTTSSTCPQEQVCTATATTESCGDSMDCIAAPFECGVDTPTVALPASDKNYSSVPDASGGAIRDGSYRLTKASFNGDYSSVRGEGLKIRSGYIHRKYTTYNASSGSALTGAELVGEFATTSTSISVETTHCTMGASAREVWGYTATATGLVLFKGDNTLRWAETYVLE